MAQDAITRNAQEKQKWMLKYFDVCEAPIKEWVAEALHVDNIHSIFDDYVDNADMLSVKSKKNYRLYVKQAPKDSGRNFKLTQEQIKSDDKLHRAVSMILDAVYMVYPPVIKTMQAYNDMFVNVFPKFEESDMSFELICINPLKNKKEHYLKEVMRVQQKIKNIEELEDKKGCKQSIDNFTIEELIPVLNDFTKKHNEIANEDIAKLDEHKKLIDKQLKDASKLFICLDINKALDDHNKIFKHMPKFGMKYQDPGEETLIDKVKRTGRID